MMVFGGWLETDRWVDGGDLKLLLLVSVFSLWEHVSGCSATTSPSPLLTAGIYQKG